MWRIIKIMKFLYVKGFSVNKCWFVVSRYFFNLVMLFICQLYVLQSRDPESRDPGIQTAFSIPGFLEQAQNYPIS